LSFLLQTFKEEIIWDMYMHFCENENIDEAWPKQSSNFGSSTG